MTTILILTDPHDEQSRIVTQALTHKQVTTIRWFPQDFINHQLGQFYIHHEGRSRMQLKGKCDIDFSQVQVVWHRSLLNPILPEKTPSPDRDFIVAENTSYLQSLYLALSHQSVWVNPLSSQNKLKSNAFQLIEASKLGITIPETLMTNDRQCIIDFMRKQYFGTIYKTFTSPSWEENGILYNFKAITLTEDMIPDQNIIQLTPGIYQRKVPHAYSVLAVLMADKVLAFKHDSKQDIDWNALKQYSSLPITPYQLPSLVERQCQRLMERLGIVFGCCHFLVTPDKDHVFLSIHENTEFLWLEKHLPECKLLDSFCDFLIHQANSRNPNWPDNHQKLTLSEVIGSQAYQTLQLRDNHLGSNAL